jgi:hypothetical protein
MANRTKSDIHNVRGKIGIGTSPAKALHVVAQSGETETLVIEGNDSLGKQLILGYNATGNGYGTIQTVYQGTAFTPLSINSSGGNVGIGTTTPDSKLSVQSTSSAIFRMIRNQNLFGFEASGNSSGGYGLYDYQSSDYDIFFKSGSVGIGTTSPTHKAHILDASYDRYTIRIQGGQANYAAGWSGIGFSGESNNTKGAILFESLGTSYSRGKMIFALNNEENQNSTTPSNHVMTLEPSGNVGIGTTSPNRDLHVIGQIALDNAATNPSAGMLITADGTSNKIYSRTANNNSTPLAFEILSGASSSLYITSGGNVGIGTTTPASTLDVNGDIAVKGNPIINRTSNALTIGDIGNLDDIGFITLSTANDNTVLHLDDSGNVGIGTTSPAKKLVVAASSQNWATAPQIAFYDTTVGQTGARNWTVGAVATSWGSFNIASSTAAGGDPTTARLTIKNNGYVGIGTTSPNFHLDVNGSIQSRNQMRAAIYYDYTNTAYYTRPASSDYSGQLKGTLNSENGFSAAIGAVNSTDGVRLTSPGGGSFNSNGNSTGAIKISLPLYQSNKMVNITVEVYDYSNYESFTLKCGGYAAANWANVYAYIMSGAILDRNLPVRFGHDGVKNCIWIGNTNQTWSFLNVYITDVQVGYNTVSAFQWSKNWNISLVTSYDTIQAQIFETQMNNWRKINNNVALGSSSSRVGIGNFSPGCRLNTNQNIINSILIRGENPSGQTVGVDGTANLGATHMSTFMGSGTTAGLLLANNVNTVDAPSPLIAFSARVSSNNYNTTYAAIYGVNKGQTTAGTIWNKGCIVLATADTDKVVERMRIDQDGNVGIGIDSPNSTVDINGTAMQQLRLRNPGGPSATTDLNGREGDFAYDDLYLYVKTGGGWGRVALDFAF